MAKCLVDASSYWFSVLYTCFALPTSQKACVQAGGLRRELKLISSRAYWEALGPGVGVGGGAGLLFLSFDVWPLGEPFYLAVASALMSLFEIIVSGPFIPGLGFPC